MSRPREPFQSETGRAIDSLVSSSPLFYTVSGGSEGERQRPKYYEQLGCPSILKPSFRDLTGTTRMSVGVPSTSSRSFPLDKLDKTMGKSPTTQAKRYGRGEKYIPPIKVNAKIRHIYSHITSSQSSQQSSIATTSTQTDFDTIDIIDKESLDEEAPVEEIVIKQDASTSMSPPPPQLRSPSTSSYDVNRLFTMPLPYAGKLENFENITGHIIIQRVITTRSDESGNFGSWLEKQLGMNSKSVGVDTSESFEGTEKDKRKSGLENVQFMQTDTNDESLQKVNTECQLSDLIKCECFREYYDVQDTGKISSPIALDPSLKINQDLSPLEQDLISQCIEYEIAGGTSQLIQPRMIPNSEETDNVRLSVQQTKNPDDTNTESTINDEELDSRLKSLDLEWVKEEQAEEDNVFLVDNVFEDKIEADETKPQACIVLPQNEIRDESQNESEIDDASPEQIQTLLSISKELSEDNKCIPDIIEVSDLMKLEKSLAEGSMESPNLTKLIESDSSNVLESQSKVAEYLAELERTSAAPDLNNDAKDCTNEPMDQGESSSQHLLTERKITRSVSIDSCIGTESSGEARHGVHESGTPVDSGRMTQDDLQSSAPQELNENPESEVQQSEAESKNPWGNQDSQEQEIVTIMSSKSMDESNSRSEMSSAIKQGSDGEDADMSESDSEFSSLRRPAGSVMSAVVEELGREDIENALMVQNDDDDDENEDGVDEVDEFDAIIESHEKEKRLRPVCRKRNATTQTTKSVESSVLSGNSTSRSTTATSDSSFDLEFVSKSKKFVTNLSSGNSVDKRRAYLPGASSSLNVLNMKFTMGKEFESEVSIRIPPNSGSVSSQKGGSLVGGTSAGGSGRNEKARGSQGKIGQDAELKNLWKDVKKRMDYRVGEIGEFPSIPPGEMHIRGNRVKLLSSASEPNIELNLPGRTVEGTEGFVEMAAVANEDEKIKRSLKRLKKILDD